MKTLLIFPPQAQPFLPHLALPYLTAALKKAGLEVEQRDYNLECYEYFLSPERLVDAGISDFIAGQIEEIKKSLRTGHEYLLPSDYFATMEILQQYLIYISRTRPHTRWSLKDFIMGYNPVNSEGILKGARDGKANLFRPFFQEKLKEIQEINPGLVGISTAWRSQVLPAFTLAYMIKENFPSVHVNLGGSMISHLSGYLQHKRKIFQLMDSFLPFEGETGLVELARALQEGSGIEHVPGLIYRHKKKVIFNKPQIPESLDALAFPDFDGFPLKKYYSPRTYLPISASRGCYWAKCAFCTHHLSGSSFRKRSAESVFNEMNLQNEKYQCLDFYFVDDAIPPAEARKLAELVEQSGKPYRWVGELRAEKSMDGEFFKQLHRGGCRMILFGLESYCERTLERMNKGIKRETAARCIRDCSEAGIITWVFFFLGFPGERRYEARETMDFIRENNSHIDMVAGGSFVLTRESEVFRNPDKFGVTNIRQSPAEDMQLDYPFDLKEGLKPENVETLLDNFRKDPAVQKFMEPFVSEPHLLYFRKSYFQQKPTGRETI